MVPSPCRQDKGKKTNGKWGAQCDEQEGDGRVVFAVSRRRFFLKLATGKVNVSCREE